MENTPYPLFEPNNTKGPKPKKVKDPLTGIETTVLPADYLDWDMWFAQNQVNKPNNISRPIDKTPDEYKDGPLTKDGLPVRQTSSYHIDDYFNSGLLAFNAALSYMDETRKKEAFENRTRDLFQPSTVYTNNMHGQDTGIILASHGAKIHKSSIENASVIAEGGETLYNPTDPLIQGVFDIKGPSHEEGGVPISKNQAKPNTVIFSDKLKVPKGNKYAGHTFATASKKYQTEYDYEVLDSIRATPQEKESAKLNIEFKERKLAELADIQQMLNGNNTAGYAEEGVVSKSNNLSEEVLNLAVEPPYSIKEAYTEKGIKRFNALRKELGLSEVKSIDIKSIEEMQSKAVETNPQLVADYVTRRANPSNATKSAASKYKGDVSKLTPEEAMAAYKDKQWWYRGVSKQERPAESLEAYNKWLEEAPKSGVKQGDKYYTYDDKLDDGTYYTYTPPVAAPSVGAPAAPPKSDESSPVPPNYTIDRGITRTEKTPYKVTPFALEDSLPYVSSFINAMRTYNYQPADYTHWEMNPQEMNIRPQLEEINQSINTAMRQTTGSPQLQAIRNQQLFGAGLDAKQKAFGQKENFDAQQRQQVDQFNISARNQEMSSDITAWMPVYNEFMAAAQDAAATERLRAVNALHTARKKHIQNENMMKLYDDSLFQYISLQDGEVNVDPKAKPTFTNSYNYDPTNKR